MAGGAVAHHLDRPVTAAVRICAMAIGTVQRGAVASCAAKLLRHARDAAGLQEMQIVRKDKPAVLQRTVGERDPFDARLLRRNRHQGAEVGMTIPIGDVEEGRVRQAAFETGMAAGAIGSDDLIRRHDLHVGRGGRADMLGVATRAAPVRMIERPRERGMDVVTQSVARRLRLRQSVRGGVIARRLGRDGASGVAQLRHKAQRLPAWSDRPYGKRRMHRRAPRRTASGDRPGQLPSRKRWPGDSAPPSHCTSARGICGADAATGASR